MVSQIFAAIQNAKATVHPVLFYDQGFKTPLYDYVIGLTQGRVIVYIEAKVRPDCLDKGRHFLNSINFCKF